MSETPARSAAAIEAELEATRLALTDTVNELHYRLKPSTQINNAKVAAVNLAQGAGDSALGFLHDTTAMAGRFAVGTSTMVRKVATDAKNGQGPAIAILVGGVAVVGLLIAIPFRRSRR
ncbi:MAG: DUF3618 domain-containing protein [Ruaniaceae bacterium]|nr:DUF3618 domain-containing protein [Ruaniaceae bacterium]